jgi:hypothetical protein
MVGNGNGINTDITEDTIKPDENKAFFSSFYTMWQLFSVHRTVLKSLCILSKDSKQYDLKTSR